MLDFSFVPLLFGLCPEALPLPRIESQYIFVEREPSGRRRRPAAAAATAAAAAAAAMGKKKRGGEPTPRPLSPRIAEAVHALRGGTRAARTKAANTIGLAAAGSDVHRMDIVQAGALEPLITLLSGSEDEKEAAAFALQGLSANPSVYTLRASSLAPYDNPTALVEAGAVEPLVALLRAATSTSAQVEHAAAVLGNIANKASHRGAIGAAGAIPPLVKLSWSPQESTAMAAVFALGSLSFCHPANRLRVHDADGHKALAALMVNASETLRPTVEYAQRQII